MKKKHIIEQLHLASIGKEGKKIDNKEIIQEIKKT